MPVGSAPAPAQRLNPQFQIGQEPHVMVTQYMAAVPRALLRVPIANLSAQHGEIMAALDMALVGF
jgi:toxin CcdB